MQTRLITTYEEATALKEAGWPQDWREYAYLVVSPPFESQAGQPDLVHSSEDCAGDIRAVAPRLDELVLFLVARGYTVSLDPKGASFINRDGCLLAGEPRFSSSEPINALVRVVRGCLYRTPE